MPGGFRKPVVKGLTPCTPGPWEACHEPVPLQAKKGTRLCQRVEGDARVTVVLENLGEVLVKHHNTVIISVALLGFGSRRIKSQVWGKDTIITYLDPEGGLHLFGGWLRHDEAAFGYERGQEVAFACAHVRLLKVRRVSLFWLGSLCLSSVC